MVANQRQPGIKEYRKCRYNSPVSKGLYRRDAGSAHLFLRLNHTCFDSFVAAVVRLKDAEALVDAHNPKGLQSTGCPNLPLLRFGHLGFLV